MRLLRLTWEAKIKLDKLGLEPERYGLLRKDDRAIVVADKHTGETVTLERKK